jgi:hypothetical protein
MAPPVEKLDALKAEIHFMDIIKMDSSGKLLLLC